jgi:hypothetical protein
MGVFAAVKDDGEVITWGRYTGECPAPREGSLKAIQMLVAGDNEFAALDEDGKMTTWCTSSFKTARSVEGVMSIYSTSKAFATLDSFGNLQSIDCMGKQLPEGGDYTHFVNVFSTQDYFLALKQDGTMLMWHSCNRSGGNTITVPAELKDAVTAYANEEAFVARTDAGKVWAFGQPSAGGCMDSNGQSTSSDYTCMPSTLDTVVDVAATPRAFAALKADGTVVAWGDQSQGGCMRATATVVGGYSCVATTLSGVLSITGGNGAFAALVYGATGNTVYVWGDLVDGGANSAGTIAVGSSTYTYDAPSTLTNGYSIIYSDRRLWADSTIGSLMPCPYGMYGDSGMCYNCPSGGESPVPVGRSGFRSDIGSCVKCPAGYVFCYTIFLPSFLVCDLSVSLLSIYYCLSTFFDTTWHESNHHSPLSIDTLLTLLVILQALLKRWPELHTEMCCRKIHATLHAVALRCALSRLLARNVQYRNRINYVYEVCRR